MTPEEIQEFYFVRPAAAFVRGMELRGDFAEALPEHWRVCPLHELSPGDCAAIIAHGLEQGHRLHRFKRTMELPRVAKVLGWLRGFAPASLLDVGSGRGAFLWPFVDAFASLPVTVVEADSNRAGQLRSVARGGLEQLTVVQDDITTVADPAEPRDIVTALEVWEHIPNVQRAALRCVELARRAVIVSVPSKEDDNPEHVHLLTRPRLRELLDLPGVKRVRFDAVPGHLLAIATLTDDA